MINDYILIIGAMKSGTTTLFDLLATHPRIAPSRPKEPGFFAFEDRWAEGFKWYESLFDFDPDRHIYALDGSTDYSKYPFCTNVAERLRQSAPRRFKLIYLIRHPLRRIESHARHVQHKRKEIGQTQSPRADHGLDAGISPVSLTVSRYASQLDQFCSFHENGDLLILSFEELIANQTAVLERVFAFLSLKPVALERFHSNAKEAVRRVSPIWSVLNRLGPLTTLGKFVVPKFLRDHLRKALTRKVTVTGRFSLTQEEEEEVLTELTPDIARLANFYGVDTKRLWNIAAASPVGASVQKAEIRKSAVT